MSETTHSVTRSGGRAARPDPLRFDRAALAAAAILVLGACSSPAPEPPPIPVGAKVSVERYFPLTAKSRWTYRVQELRKGFDYLNRVRVYGARRFEPLARDVIQVEESYSSTGSGVFLLEEQEPVVYFLEDGYLNRMFLTRQAGKLIATSGSGDSRFLPATIEIGGHWDSSSQAFRVGNDLGFRVSHSHRIEIEPEPVEVPAGEFRNCIRIDTFSSHGPGSGSGSDELAFFYSDWYAPGVGLVKTQQWDDEAHSKERTRIELIEYSVEPPAADEKSAAGTLSPALDGAGS